jgi:hypothetical protein
MDPGVKNHDDVKKRTAMPKISSLGDHSWAGTDQASGLHLEFWETLWIGESEILRGRGLERRKVRDQEAIVCQTQQARPSTQKKGKTGGEEEGGGEERRAETERDESWGWWKKDGGRSAAAEESFLFQGHGVLRRKLREWGNEETVNSAFLVHRP